MGKVYYRSCPTVLSSDNRTILKGKCKICQPVGQWDAPIVAPGYFGVKRS